MSGSEAAYLRELVGDALARGCAATVVAHPKDPVAYLGEWLLRYVKNAEVEGNFYQQKQTNILAEAKRNEDQATVKKNAEDIEAAKKAGLEKLVNTVADPETLWQQAVDLVTKYTKASASYLANIVEPEVADWAPQDGDEAAEAETDDEVEEIREAAIPDEAEQPAEGADAAQDEPPPPPSTLGPPAPAAEAHFDYSRKLLTYCVSSPGQEFIKDVELTRPVPLTDDQVEAGAIQDTPAITFRVLDEKLPVLNIPNVAFEPRVKFFRKFPRVGAYKACAVTLASGEYRQVLCADTLLPEGSGRPFTKAEQDFIWEVALSLSRAADAAQQRLREHSMMATGGEEVARMRARIRDVYRPPPPPAEAELEAEAAAATMPASTPKAAAEEPTPAAAAAATAEGEGAEAAEPVEPTAEELEIRRLQEEVAARDAELESLLAAAGAALSAQQTEQQVLAVVKECIMGVEIIALRNFRMYTTTPAETFHVLKAVLLLLGKALPDIATWKRCMLHVNPAMFKDISSYDATQERDMALWKLIRSCYKAASSAEALQHEMPSTHLGVMLVRFIKQVRRVAKATVAAKAAEAAVAAKQQERDQLASELDAATQAKENAEAALAAEAAAAAAAAEAAEAAVVEGEGDARTEAAAAAAEAAED